MDCKFFPKYKHTFSVTADKKKVQEKTFKSIDVRKAKCNFASKQLVVPPMSVYTASNFLKSTQRSVYSLIYRGKLKSFWYRGGRYLVPKSVFDYDKKRRKI